MSEFFYDPLRRATPSNVASAFFRRSRNSVAPPATLRTLSIEQVGATGTKTSNKRAANCTVMLRHFDVRWAATPNDINGGTDNLPKTAIGKPVNSGNFGPDKGCSAIKSKLSKAPSCGKTATHGWFYFHSKGIAVSNTFQSPCRIRDPFSVHWLTLPCASSFVGQYS